MPNDVAFDFGLKIKSLRKKFGLSQNDLAKKLHVSKGSIYRYECNTQTPPIDTLIQMSLIFHVTVDYLVGLDRNHAVKIYGLTERQEKAIYEFVDSFRQP